MASLSHMRIGFIAGTLGQGGAERQLVYLLQTLREAGAQVRLLCLTRGEFWERQISELGIPITRVGQHRSEVVRLGLMIIALHRSSLDIVQSQHAYTNIYAAGVARVLKLRDVGAIRNDTLREIQAIGHMGRLSLWVSRILAVNSRFALRQANELGIPHARLYLLPNVIDTDYFRPVARAAGGAVRLVAVGRLVAQKRHDRFLSLLARVRQQTSIDVRGTIVGSGRNGNDKRPHLEQQAEELGLLPDGVTFLPTAADIRTVYRQADILVLTSDWEGTPNVVIEAMACGLPVVATRVGGTPDLIQHSETGYLAAPDDEDAMADALLSLIEHPHLRAAIGARAREAIETERSLHRLPDILEKLYQRALA